jgi:hypothetical protein
LTTPRARSGSRRPPDGVDGVDGTTRTRHHRLPWLRVDVERRVALGLPHRTYADHRICPDVFMLISMFSTPTIDSP